jgi:polyisoprenoid-binding protein YceI
MTTATATATPLKTYQIDRAHSEAAFQVRHLITKVRGRFAEFDGTIAFAPETPASSSVEFVIQTKSIDTNQAQRDEHLRSADFFDVEKFPLLTFKSTAVTARGAGHYAVTGELTIRDVTKTITLPVTYLGAAKDPWGNDKVAFETEITLNRKDYGLNWNAALETGGFLVGDDVKVSLSIQAA